MEEERGETIGEEGLLVLPPKLGVYLFIRHDDGNDIFWQTALYIIFLFFSVLYVLP